MASGTSASVQQRSPAEADEAGFHTVFLSLADYSERTQAYLRLLVWSSLALLLTAVFYFLPYSPEVEPVYFQLMRLVLGALIAAGVLYLLQFRFSALGSAILGILLDYATLGLAMYLAPVLMAPALALFPLIALSNGMRYGTKMLAYCMILGFVVLYVVSTAPWYSDHWPLLLLAFLQIIAIPVVVHLIIVALKRAKEVAQRANRAKTAFLATMSHELRTPLTAIISGAEMSVLEGSDRYIETIRSNADALLDTVNDVLDLASLEHGDLPYKPVPFDFSILQNQLHRGLGPKAQVKNIELTIDAMPPPGVVVGDRRRIRQVLTNLIGNAIKFTPNDGKVTAKIRYYEPICSIDIVDTGPGIPAEHLNDIWKPFFQGSSGAARTHSGTGLGLAIVQSLVTKMGGTVAVQSRLGEGSRFRVRFPLPLTDLPAAPLGAEDRNEYVQEHKRTVRSKRLLVVDDEATNRNLIRRMLMRAGHRVYEASNAAEALRAYGMGSWDLILLDHHMPGQTGLEVLESIRSREDVTPVVVLTGDVTEELKQSAMSAGARGVVTKPVNLIELLEAVERHAN